MAKRQQEPIKTRSFVTVNGEVVPVDTLPAEMRQEVATQLTLTWMNAMFRGKAVFTVAENKRGGSLHEKDQEARPGPEI